MIRKYILEMSGSLWDQDRAETHNLMHTLDLPQSEASKLIAHYTKWALITPNGNKMLIKTHDNGSVVSDMGQSRIKGKDFSVFRDSNQADHLETLLNQWGMVGIPSYKIHKVNSSQELQDYE